MSTIKDNAGANFIPKKQNKEVLTPHRLTVGILTMEFYKVREFAVFCTQRRAFIREFCLLILKLIQSPDLTFAELHNLISQVEYSLCKDQFLESFLATIKNLISGIGALQDAVDNIVQLMQLDNQLGAIKVGVIGKNSVVGCYLRRLVLNFDKLSFSEISIFFESYKSYCGPFINGSLEQPHCALDSSKKSTLNQNLNRDWTQRQAELFIATQSALIANNEGKALSPNELHKYIKSLLKSNPDLSAAHFLNYLNYLRVKEYCGAIDSLYHCFDKSANNDKANADARTKTYRYAALNLAILQCQFGHKQEGLLALKESIKMAQESSDNQCLQHALSWLRCLTSNQHKLIAEQSAIKYVDLNLSYVMSLGIQSFVKFCGLSTAHPQIVLDSLTRSDIINSEHGHGDLIATNYGLKAGLWLFYGKTEMSSLWSQLLLYLNTDSLLVNKTYYGESYVQALCNMAGLMHQEGEYALSNTILSHAEERFPNEPMNHSVMFCRNVFHFYRLLYNEKPTAAASIAAKVAVVDKWESYLCFAQLYLHTGDYSEAHQYCNRILDECKDNNSHVRMDMQVRAMILLSDVQIASNFPNAAIPGVMGLLNSSLAYANDYNMHYLAAMAQLRIAHVLLLLKMPQQASKVLQRCIIQILTDGGCYDRAKVLMLQAHCTIACCNGSGASKTRQKEVIQEVLQDLSLVQKDFEKVEAVFRVKDILILQAKLCDEIGFEKQRNRHALDYRTLNAEHASVYGSQLFKMI
ncbi:anaphase-promoting complex subunit 5-like [Atheta coriaria]|uniref:anaphase-promoting complex subunit 5-like n=1 Tax=Dalotia coriaria TaxID=877792 RepID=UPI0031F460F2